jgi:uncharacterized membrane protein YqgA involved in biofilm formation
MKGFFKNSTSPREGEGRKKSDRKVLPLFPCATDTQALLLAPCNGLTQGGFILFGTVVNALAIIGGSLLGLLLRGGIPRKYNVSVIHAVGLAVVLVGVRSALKSDDILLIIFSLAIGTVLGELLRIEDRLETLGQRLEERFAGAGEGVAKGFVTASLIYCVGSMAIVGSMESGLTGNHQTLFAKSVLDGISAIIFASSFGVGVMLSSLSVFAYQGAVTVGASFLRQFLVPEVVAQMSAVGGLLIAAIGLNLLDLQKLRIGNMLPAVFLPLVYFMIRTLAM